MEEIKQQIQEDELMGADNMLIKALVDTVIFKEKPNKNDIKYIKPRLQGKIKPKEYTLDEFCREIEQGKTVSPGILQGGCGAIHWTGQNLFMSDIDNDIEGIKELSQEDILNICADNNIKPSFIYESFNSSAAKRKYRVGFLCNEYITEEGKRKIIAKTLLVLFPQADNACANADRIFFGTNKKVNYKDYNAFFTFEQLIEIGSAKAAEKERASANEEAVQLLQHNSNIDLNYEIQKFDLFSYMQNICGEISHSGANYDMFHCCPICGGHDDLVYYHDSRLFTCFGKYGRKTGNIINFLMETKNMTKSEAVKYFLYDMLGYKRPNYNQLSPSKAGLNNISAEISKLCNIFHTLKTPPEKYSTDDKGLGELFAAAVKDFLRYNRTHNKWMYYNEKVWIDDTGDCAVNKWIKHFTDALYLYSCDDSIYADLTDEKQKNEAVNNFRKGIKQLSSKAKRDTIVKDAQSEYPISNNDLDADKDLFNCKNGTLNLKTFEFSGHKAEDMLSMISNVHYNPKASAEVFENVLNQIFEGNQEKISYIKRAFGYSLTADTKEDVFFILYGSSTRNGKSTCTETHMYMLGDYAKQSAPETFAVKKFADSRNASSDIARLRGARFVGVTELPKGMVLNSALIKSFTGGDTITARFQYERETQFRPYCKIFINTNYLPQINDDTIFRSKRVHVITFDKHFTEEEQDKDLKYKLRQDDVLSGILNWCIEGLKDYRNQGLNPPECVLESVEKYEVMSNIINQFLEGCFIHSDSYTKAKDAYNLYCNWCANQDLAADKKTVFYEKLRQTGIMGTKDGNHNVLIGYERKSDSPF